MVYEGTIDDERRMIHQRRSVDEKGVDALASFADSHAIWSTNFASPPRRFDDAVDHYKIGYTFPPGMVDGSG